jgi:alpha-1,6-mannosyltransferase
MAAANNGAAFAEAIKVLLARLSAEQSLRSSCHHQAENFPWSSTISQMLSLSTPRRLRVA